MRAGRLLRVRSARRLTAAAAVIVAAGLPVPAFAAGPADMQFTTITTHNPQAFIRALRAGADFTRGGGGKRFRIVLAAGGVIVAIPGIAISQLEYMKTKRPAGLEIIACKETVDALAKANKRRMPVLPGIKVQGCESMRSKMMLAGWQPAPGF